MRRSAIYFTGQRAIEVREEVLPELQANEVLVETEVSAVSAGTEMLLYRGEFPDGNPDGSDAISSSMGYPMMYGYAAVGRVKQTGTSVDPQWNSRLIFGFMPHASHFIATPDNLSLIPRSVTPDDAVFLPNIETAVNLVQDASPILGERVLVLGQGVVGLLSTVLLGEFPLDCLVTADRYETRRHTSESIGVTAALDAGARNFYDAALEHTGPQRMGFDCVVEVTGHPSALDDAIALTTFSGRIIIGSWFGKKISPINLGGRFHRSRIQLIASQVSTISPTLSGRWNKERRFQVGWKALERIQPSRWITHRFPINRAAEAYQLLDKSPEKAIQVVLTY